jgi:hypothetical protein
MSKGGWWRVVKLCTTAQHLYCRCFRKESGAASRYMFKHYLAKDCSSIVNEHAHRGLQMVDFGTAGPGKVAAGFA